MGDEKKLTTRRSSRFLKLSSLTARVAGSYLGEQVRERLLSPESRDRALAETHKANAVRVLQTFGQLKGAVMKLGQHMSMMSDILPLEITEVLSKLQSTAPSVPFSQLTQLFKKELGEEPQTLFAGFDSEAFASASIGQVHRAQLPDGREVVVKIQYPNVDQMVESDLNNLITFARSMQWMWSKADLGRLAEEVRERLVEELDYRLELENINFFRHMFEENEQVVIPEPIPEFCSQRVLTMTFVPGLNWDTICSAQVSQQQRNRFATGLLDFTFRQFFEFGILHADPHPGNFSLDEKGRIAVYDFGCVKRYPKFFVEAYRDLLDDSINRRYENLPRGMARIGAHYAGKNLPPEELYIETNEAVLEPFFMPQPYRMHLADAHIKMHNLGMKYFRYYMNFKVPKDIVMLNRVIGGMYGNLRRLKAEVDLHAVVRPYVEIKET